MKNKKTKLTTSLLLSIGLTGTYAQQATDAAGGNASGSGGSVSYSVGQVVYTTHTGTNGSVAQGVQQAYEISIATGINDTEDTGIHLSAYPNPAKDILNLKVDHYTEGKFLYQLFDISGKLLEAKHIEAKEISITMSNWPQATYFLKITQNHEVIKTFKILKN